MTPLRSPAAVAVLAFLVVAAAASGCQPRGPATPAGSGATIAVGSSSQTITVDGRDRVFHLYRPATLDQPAALVVMLHGGFGTGEQAQQSYGWDEQADAEHFLVAYPDGLDRAWSAGGGCCGVPGRSGVDDVAFVTAMVAALSGQVRLDPDRLYATGISNGGMLAYRLACQRDLFAAIGPVSATLLGECATGLSAGDRGGATGLSAGDRGGATGLSAAPAPISVIHIHGDADTRVPYLGGEGDGVAHIEGPAVPAVLERWRIVNGCAAPQQSTAGPVTVSLATCPSGRAVQLVTIAGAGHQWPGAAPRPLAQLLLGTDPPSTALDATATIWAFFATHPRPA